MTHYDTLVACGIPHEQAMRDAYANEIQMWRNREHASYGRQYEAEQIADATPSTDYYERG